MQIKKYKVILVFAGGWKDAREVDYTRFLSRLQLNITHINM